MGKAELFTLPGRRAPATPLESLREVLDALEQRLGSLASSTAEAALETPRLFDQAAALLEALRARDAEIAAEETRFATVSAMCRSKAPVFLRRIGGVAALAAERERVRPAASAWWWTLDLWWAEQRRAVFQRRLKWVGLTAALLALLGIIYARFFAPDPLTRAVLDYQFRATDLAITGEYAPALEQVALALVLSPEEPELLVLQGVLQEALGDVAAPETFAAAERAFDNREQFLTARGQLYLQMGQFEAAQQAAEALLAVNAQSPTAYLYRGMAAEALGDRQQALADYQRAGELAQEQKQHQIYVTARNLMGNLLMQTGP